MLHRQHGMCGEHRGGSDNISEINEGKHARLPFSDYPVFSSSRWVPKVAVLRDLCLRRPKSTGLLRNWVAWACTHARFLYDAERHGHEYMPMPPEYVSCVACAAQPHDNSEYRDPWHPQKWYGCGSRVRRKLKN